MPESAMSSLKRPAGNGHLERRKVRKGTQSCWECKRRKIRCLFDGTEDAICKPCKQRGTVCLSQEFPDTGRTSQVDDRISRVESLLEQVLERLDDGRTRPDGEAPQTTGEETVVEVTGERQRRSLMDEFSEYDELSRALLATLPSRHDLEFMADMSFETPSCLYGLPCMEQAASLDDLLRLPPSGTHPIIATKNVLILSSCLRSISQVDLGAIADECVQTARRLVLSQDGLVQSINGVECLAIESMYYNNAGDLRQAWLTLRRGMLIAQMLGLHRAAHSPAYDSITRNETTTEQLWYHLVQSDRYLCLMLGLPQGAHSSNGFASPEVLAACTPVQRLQRLHTFAAGRLIQQREAGVDDLAFTKDIDTLLQTAANAIDSQWWLIPSLAGQQSSQSCEEVLRLMSQFSHFHLLARIHLPYLLRSSPDNDQGGHKAITISASREVLLRYVSFLDSGATNNNYCHGIDFLMFVASTTLCIAYINSSYQRHFSNNTTGFSLLDHQRPGDRGLMERALEILQRTDRSKKSDAVMRIATVLRHLLRYEAAAANGEMLTTSALDTHGTLECGGRVDEEANVLHIDISYIGVVKISPYQVSYIARPGHAGEHTEASLAENVSMHLESDQWPLQGVDTAFFNDLIGDWNLHGIEGL